MEHADPKNFEQRALFKRAVFSQMRLEVTPGNIIPYEPHPTQMKIHFPKEEWSYFVFCAGRRSGKTIAAASEIIAELGIPRTRTWIVAPNYELTDRVFEYVYDQVVRKQIFGRGSVKRSSKTRDSRYIEMEWGAFVQGKSGEAPDSLIGEQLDLIVFDECARCDENIWTECLEPTTLDRKGRVLFISTPRGHNWFRTYYLRGLDDKMREKGWRSAHMASWENPFLPKAWIESKKDEVQEVTWNQEYGAKFEHVAGLIYPEYTDSLAPEGHLFDPDTVRIDSTWTHFLGIDVGQRLPTGAVWGAVNRAGDIYIYQDYNEVRPSHRDHAEEIMARTQHRLTMSFISPDAKRENVVTREDRKHSAWNEYRRVGLYTKAAFNNWDAGVSIVAAYLRASLQRGKSDHPCLYISERLNGLRSDFQNLIYKESNLFKSQDPPEMQRKYQDHRMDALRYLVAARPQFRDFHNRPGTDFERMTERYGYTETVFGQSPRTVTRPHVPGMPRVPRA